MHDANTHQEDAEESRARYHSTHSEANTKDRHHTRGHPRLSRGARGDVATLRTLRRALEKPERADEVCEEPSRSRGTVLVARDGAPVTSTIWPRPPRRKEPLRPLCPAVRQAAGRAWQVVATEEPSVMSGSLLRPAPSAGLRPPSAHGHVFTADPGVAAKRPPRRPPAPRLTPPSWARKAVVPSVPLSGGLPVSVPWGRPAFSSVTFWSVAALAET